MQRTVRVVLIIVVAVACGLAAALLIFNLLGGTGPVAAPPSSSEEGGRPDVPRTASSSQSAEEPAQPLVHYIDEGELELPIAGATGYTLIDTPIWSTPDVGTQASATLPAGTGFAVMEEQGEWWRIEGDTASGWVLWGNCMVNLPDVIPSIVYNDTNSYASAFLSCGKEIPGITGQALYDAEEYNERLGREEYIMPVLYPMAKRICAAQQAALAEGNTLVIYEAYRPFATQRQVVEGVSALANTDEAVRNALNAAPWGIDWFIATGISNHQMGYAVDLSLASADGTELAESGGYSYTLVSGSTLYPMQTPIHELSPAAASLVQPVSPRTAEWQYIAPAEGMNDNALLLKRYCTEAGMTPLASEWWHFNDYTALSSEVEAQAAGNFLVEKCYSFAPENA